jgi:hypothetical protein
MFIVTLLTTSDLTGLLLLFATLDHSQPSVHFAHEGSLLGASFTVTKVQRYIQPYVAPFMCDLTRRSLTGKCSLSDIPPNRPLPPPNLLKKNRK